MAAMVEQAMLKVQMNYWTRRVTTGILVGLVNTPSESEVLVANRTDNSDAP